MRFKSRHYLVLAVAIPASMLLLGDVALAAGFATGLGGAGVLLLLHRRRSRHRATRETSGTQSTGRGAI